MQQFLTNLLPGLRDARAPLAAGYLWLLSIWLMLADDLPTKSEATGVLAAVYRLGDALGPISAVLAVSFAAYLVGVVSQTLTDAVLRAATRFWYLSYSSRSRVPLSVDSQRSARNYVYDRIRDSFRSLREQHLDVLVFVSDNYGIDQAQLTKDLERELLGTVRNVVRTGYPYGDWEVVYEVVYAEQTSLLSVGMAAGISDLVQRLWDRLRHERSPASHGSVISEAELDEFLEAFKVSEQVGEVIRDLDPRPDLEQLALTQVVEGNFTAVSEQLHLIEARLMKENAEQYGRFDRLKSESELRLALSLPLLVLVVVLSIGVSWFYLAALIPIFLLTMSGWTRGREAGDTLIDALQTTEALVPPSVQRFQLDVERATRDSNRPSSSGP